MKLLQNKILQIPQIITTYRISSAVCTYILNELLTSKNETIRQIAESHDWYIFPVVNPDGFAYSHTGVSIIYNHCSTISYFTIFMLIERVRTNKYWTINIFNIALQDRLWRKTRTPYGLCQGADPNRNWDYQWNTGGASGIPCTDTYHGPSAFSEVSTKSLSNFISGIAKDLVAYFAFHSYSQLLLLPYGTNETHLDNYEKMVSANYVENIIFIYCSNNKNNLLFWYANPIEYGEDNLER